MMTPPEFLPHKGAVIEGVTTRGGRRTKAVLGVVGSVRPTPHGGKVQGIAARRCRAMTAPPQLGARTGTGSCESATAAPIADYRLA